jgi:SHS2 domain-containing protein
LASKEVAKMAKVEKVEERIARDEVHDLDSLLLLLLSEMRVVIKTPCVVFFRRWVRGGKKVSRSWKRKNWGLQRT